MQNDRTKKAVVFEWSALRGRKIVKVETNAFRTERDREWSADPVLTLDDGSRIHFVVDETEVGEYGIHLARHRKEFKP